MERGLRTLVSLSLLLCVCLWGVSPVWRLPLDGTAEVLVDVEVVGSTGGRLQTGDVYATDKLKNGFKLTTSGTADAVDVRLLVSHPAM